MAATDLAPGYYYIIRKTDGARVGRYKVPNHCGGRNGEYAVRRRARRRIDKLDNDYGAYVHRLVRATRVEDGWTQLEAF